MRCGDVACGCRECSRRRRAKESVDQRRTQQTGIKTLILIVASWLLSLPPSNLGRRSAATATAACETHTVLDTRKALLVVVQLSAVVRVGAMELFFISFFLELSGFLSLFISSWSRVTCREARRHLENRSSVLSCVRLGISETLLAGEDAEVPVVDPGLRMLG